MRELQSTMDYLTILEKYKKEPPETVRRIVAYLLDQQMFCTPGAVFPPQDDAPVAAEPLAPPPDACDLEILRQIAFLKRSGLPTGRNTLAGLDGIQKLGLTATNLRTRLKKLARAGYVNAGRTRQGTSLTPSALGFLAGDPATPGTA